MFHRLTRGAASLALCVLVTGGCSVFAGSGGYDTASTDRVTVEYPQDWQKAMKAASSEKVTFLAQLRKGDNVVASLAVADTALKAENVTRASRILLANQEIAAPSLQRKGSRFIDVSGEGKARRVDYVYAGSTGKKLTGHKNRATDVTIMGPRHSVTLVRISGRKSVLSKEAVNHIVDSIEVKASS